MDHAINVDVNGEVVNAFVYTGTYTNGGYFGPSCSEWTNGGSGKVGYSQFANSFWTQYASSSCVSSSRLYCIEQP